MNIFKSLSQGNGRISETNITSFLSFLLNSSNELNGSFLLLFLELVDHFLPSGKLQEKLNLRQPNLRLKIVDFQRRYAVLATPEFPVDDRQQIVDIFLKITTKQGEDLAFLLIENKVKKEANNPEQLAKQYFHFTNSEDYTVGVPVYSILLSSDHDRFAAMYNSSTEVNPHSAWLKWTNQKEPEKSIVAILRQLIKYEHEAEIQPIDPNSQFIIKSFIDYILTEYSFKEGGQKNYSFNGFDVISAASAEIDGHRYLIKRFENNMVRLFDKDENLVEIEVKPFLRTVNDHYKLGIPLAFPGGKLKNTQIFGKDIINALNGQTLSN